MNKAKRKENSDLKEVLPDKSKNIDFLLICDVVEVVINHKINMG